MRRNHGTEESASMDNLCRQGTAATFPGAILFGCLVLQVGKGSNAVISVLKFINLILEVM